MKSYFQIYTGNGKGKTTASLGLALRSLGFGHSVFIGQFMKKGDYNEIDMLSRIEAVLDSNQNLKVLQFGSGKFIGKEPSFSDIELAEEGYRECKRVIESGKYQLVILDEINVAVSIGLISVKKALELVEIAKNRCELVYTGRNVHRNLVDCADLVTEMKEVKHYMNSGVMARKGIEF